MIGNIRSFGRPHKRGNLFEVVSFVFVALPSLTVPLKSYRYNHERFLVGTHFGVCVWDVYRVRS